MHPNPKSQGAVAPSCIHSYQHHGRSLSSLSTHTIQEREQRRGQQLETIDDGIQEMVEASMQLKFSFIKQLQQNITITLPSSTALLIQKHRGRSLEHSRMLGTRDSDEMNIFYRADPAPQMSR